MYKNFVKGLNIILLCLLLVANIFLINRLNYIKQTYSSYKEFTIERAAMNKAILESVVESSMKTNSLAKFCVDRNLPLLSEKGDTVLLHQVLKDSYTLVFRYNEFSCNNCIYEEMDVLNKLTDSLNMGNVLVLSSFKNVNHLYIEVV